MFLFVCKFLHLISLFVAGGGGIGSAVIQSIYKKEGKVPEPHLSKGFQILAFLSLLAILTMWVTGVILVIYIYGSFALGWAFHMKLFGATLVLISVTFINFHLYNSSQKKSSPNQSYLKNSATISRVGLVLAIACLLYTSPSPRD